MGYTPVFDPLNELQNNSFVEMTISQITKDFARVSVFFSFEKNEKLELKTQIIEQIEKTISNLTSIELQQFIYLIDLKETDFHSASHHENFLEILSEKILYREAYKVFLRKYYSL
jgi:hypothetical protein